MAERAHEAAAAAAPAGDDQAQVAQRLEGLPGGDRRDAERLGEVDLGRKLLAVAEHTQHDRVPQPAGDRLGASRLGERGEDRTVRVRYDPARHRPSSSLVL
nr:hypothetical protein GCM10020092_041320 [Actinoplanes digitatis]